MFYVERINPLAKAKVNLKIHEKHNFISNWFCVRAGVRKLENETHTFTSIVDTHAHSVRERKQHYENRSESRIFTISFGFGVLFSFFSSFVRSFSSFSLRIFYYATMSINFAF